MTPMSRNCEIADFTNPLIGTLVHVRMFLSDEQMAAMQAHAVAHVANASEHDQERKPWTVNDSIFIAAASGIEEVAKEFNAKQAGK